MAKAKLKTKPTGRSVQSFLSGFREYGDLMKKLGKYKTGGSCLYLNSLDGVDMRVLERIVSKSVKKMVKK